MSDTTATDSDLEAFRARCVEFLDQHAAPRGTATSFAEQRAFLLAAADAGLAGIAYPVEDGGAGLTLAHEKVWREAKAGYATMDDDFVISHGMCAPMLAEYGSSAQRARFLADNLSGRTLWCQMFSEPGAGSDVASLQTKAVRDGDEWVIDGQKVWTTFAHRSDYGVIIARTDPDVPKHAGISMFIVDMHAPGVEVRQIHQIDGGSHFNEVFFTDVRIPADWLVGDLNAGWKLATAMLMYERFAIGGMGSGSVSQPVFDRLVEAARAAGRLGDPVVRDQLMRIYAMETTKSLVAIRTRDELRAGKTPGPGGSLGKLATSVITWAMREVALEIAGPSTIAREADAGRGGQLARLVVGSFQASIAGGTDEIQRNIIGERVLGLPREPSVDRGVPFRELTVGTQRT